MESSPGPSLPAHSPRAHSNQWHSPGPRLPDSSAVPATFKSRRSAVEEPSMVVTSAADAGRAAAPRATPQGIHWMGSLIARNEKSLLRLGDSIFVELMAEEIFSKSCEGRRLPQRDLRLYGLSPGSAGVCCERTIPSSDGGRRCADAHGLSAPFLMTGA